MTSGHENINVFAITQFHRHIHGVSNYRNTAVPIQARHNLGSCSSSSESNSISRRNKFGSCLSDASLLFSKTPDLILKRTIVPECLVKERFNWNRSTMGPAQKTAIFKFLQVATHSCKRDRQPVPQNIHRRGTFLTQFLQYDRGAVRLLVALL